MNKWIIINNDGVIFEELAGFEHTVLNPSQSVVRITRDNEKYFKEYVKYNAEDIISLRASGVGRLGALC